MNKATRTFFIGSREFVQLSDGYAREVDRQSTTGGLKAEKYLMPRPEDDDYPFAYSPASPRGTTTGQ